MDAYQDRVRKAQQVMEKKGIDYLVVAPSANMYYLTGLRPVADERLQIVLVPDEGLPIAILSAMYRETALMETGGKIGLLTYPDGSDPVTLVQSVVAKRQGQAAIDERMWAGHFLNLMKAFPGFSFTPMATVLKQVRMRKDVTELNLLRQSGEMADWVMGEILSEIKPGITEKRLSLSIENKLKEFGAEDLSFRPIIAFGPNGASPHHQTGDRKLAKGELVTLDFGGVRQGYCSDITRTFCLGKASPEMKKIYQTVKDAYEAGFHVARLGVTCAGVDQAAREVISKAGVGEFFIHRTGHGIGLDCHEEPYLVTGNEQPLEEGMSFSIEPGIYIPGKFGVRIEDVVAVTAQGPLRFNIFPRELIEL